MKYNVLIKKCDDAAKAARVIAEIARRSEASQKAVADAWAQRPICVSQSVQMDEAKRVKAIFDAVGATVEIVEVAHSQGAGLASFGFDMIDEDEGEGSLGRLLSEKEYADILKSRKDIFVIEKDKRLRNMEIVSLVVGLVCALWLSTVEAVRVTADYANEKKVEQRTAKLAKDVPTEKQKEEDKKKEEEKKAKEKKDKENSDKKSLEKTKTVHHSGGNGDPRARLAQQGVLGMLGGMVKSKDVADADINGAGGFASNIDAVLSGTNALKSGSSGGTGRMAAAGLGFGGGFGGGAGGGGAGGGIDDLIGSLMSSGGGSSGHKGDLALDLKKRKEPLKIQAPDIMDAGTAVVGGRTKASIMRVVVQNMSALRYAYSKRLRDKPGLKGKVTIKFAIDEFGKVIFCQVVESTMGDSDLEASLLDKIKRWVFDKIDKPGDISEVTYPFVFSQ